MKHIVSSKVMKDITAFITMSTSLSINKWFYNRYISLYLRRTKRILGNEKTECVDIATVEVSSKYRGQGIFTKYLSSIEKLACTNHFAVYVENILNQGLKDFLIKRGYIILNESNSCSCLYKKF